MNNIEDPEVLVIDDNPDFAQSAANLINTKYGLNCIPLSKKEEILETIHHNIIKVTVIDQVMPEIKGTELFLEIKKLSPETKAIMLTGEASSDEIGKAVNTGFSSYLNKRDITKLPDEVFKHYVSYETSSNSNVNNHILFKEKKLFVLPIITYSLVSIDKISNNHIFEDSWKTEIKIHAGEEHESENSIEYEDKITISNEYENKIKGELDISGKANMTCLKSTINSELNKKYSSQHSISKKAGQKNKKK